MTDLTPKQEETICEEIWAIRRENERLKLDYDLLKDTLKEERAEVERLKEGFKKCVLNDRRPVARSSGPTSSR